MCAVRTFSWSPMSQDRPNILGFGCVARQAFPLFAKKLFVFPYGGIIRFRSCENLTKLKMIKRLHRTNQVKKAVILLKTTKLDTLEVESIFQRFLCLKQIKNSLDLLLQMLKSLSLLIWREILTAH